MKMRSFACALSLAAAATLPQAGYTAGSVTLFDNGSFTNSQDALRNNMCAVFDSGGQCISRFTLYDQFVLDGKSIVSGFEWHQIEQQAENYAGTVLTIGTGTPAPDTILLTIEITADRAVTPIVPGDPLYDSVGSSAVQASVSRLKIKLDAGEYWLGIHNEYPESGGASQWSQSSGTASSIDGRWQGEGQPCGAFPTSPDGGCLKFFAGEESAFRVLGRPRGPRWAPGPPDSE